MVCFRISAVRVCPRASSRRLSCPTPLCASSRHSRRLFGVLERRRKPIVGNGHRSPREDRLSTYTRSLEDAAAGQCGGGIVYSGGGIWICGACTNPPPAPLECGETYVVFVGSAGFAACAGKKELYENSGRKTYVYAGRFRIDECYLTFTVVGSGGLKTSGVSRSPGSLWLNFS